MPATSRAQAMALPYQRGDASPRTPSYFNSGSSSPGSRGHSPVWKGSRKRAFDNKRIFQIVGFAVVIFTLFALLSTAFQSDPAEDDLLSAEGRLNRNHFVDFEGGLDCHLSSTELYVPPVHDTPAARKKMPYCKNRAHLLEALNGGGRHGFDEPFVPRGCHYKWFTPGEICMILERFDGIVFVGDMLVHQIYAAFNILLRSDLALGSLETWRMSDKERDGCRCSNQFTKPECSANFVSSSDSVAQHGSEGSHRAPYKCSKIPHFYLKIAGSPAPGDLLQKYKDLLDADPHSWKPVATIHSLGLSTSFDWRQATGSMDEWLTIADNSGRNSPFLWVGPNAAGHLKPPGKIMQEGNNALWHYTQEMGKEAARRGVEHLALYNNTLQAQSWDGSSYGERVMLTEAMMVINWLAFLETT